LKFSNRCNSASDCTIWLKFCQKFVYVISMYYKIQKFKVERSKIKVSADVTPTTFC